MYLKRLKDLRSDNDLYQKDIAKLLNISQQYYSEYERGKRSLPIELLVVLTKFYNVSADYILRLTSQRKRYKK